MHKSQHTGFSACGLVAGRTWEELKTKKPEAVSKAQRTQMGGDPGSEWLPHSEDIGWEAGPGPVMDVVTVAGGGDLVSAPTKYTRKVWTSNVSNAYINWLTYQTYPTTNKPTGREFREQLARQLCGVQLDVPAPIAGHYPTRCRVDNAPCARNCKVCCGTQWVTHLGARKQIRTGRRTVYKCSKCDVFLCIGDPSAYGEDPKTKDDFQPNCFEAFHTDPRFASMVFQ